MRLSFDRKGRGEGAKGAKGKPILLPYAKISTLKFDNNQGNVPMPALETFDWFKNEIWPKANDEMKKFLQERREYLLQIRNENERRRLIEEVMAEVKGAMKKQKN